MLTGIERLTALLSNIPQGDAFAEEVFRKMLTNSVFQREFLNSVLTIEIVNPNRARELLDAVREVCGPLPGVPAPKAAGWTPRLAGDVGGGTTTKTPCQRKPRGGAA